MGHIYTYDEIRQEFEDRGYILLTNHKLKGNEKYEYICKKHQNKGSQFIAWGHFHCNERGCYYCGIEKCATARRKNLNEDEGRALAETKGFEYVGISRHDKKIWVQFICPKHRQYGVQEMPYNNMKRVVVGCQHCIGRNDDEKEVLQEMYETNPNMKILEPYQGRRKRVKMLCLIHGIVSKKSPYEVIHGKGCYYCGLEKQAKQQKMPEDIFLQRLYNKYPHILLNQGYDCITSDANFHCCKCGCDWTDNAGYVLRRGCPICDSTSMEREIGKILTKHNINYKPQFSFADCKDRRVLPFDFYLLDYNLLIEYDGQQHYRPVNFGGISDNEALRQFKTTQKHDAIKTAYCKDNDILLLRIPYWESKNIEQIILDSIKGVITKQND